MTTKFKRYEVAFRTLPARPDEEGAVVELDLKKPGLRIEFVNAETEWNARTMLGILYSVAPDNGELIVQSIRCLGPAAISRK